MSRIVLIDGDSILQKAFYSVPMMTDTAGFHTNAVYGFLNLLFRITTEKNASEKPEYLSVVFEADNADSQKALQKMPAALCEQLPVLKELLSAMNIYIVEKAGCKVIDIIGTITARSDKKMTVVSGNRDFLQFASEHVKVSLLVTGEGKMEFVDYEAVPAHFCEALILSKALGIGEKTAANLLDTYESVENLYAHTDELPQKSIREKLEENKENIDRYRDFYTIHTDAAVDYSDEKARFDADSLFTLDADARLHQLGLSGKFEQEGQENRTPAVNLDRDLKVIEIRTTEDARRAFETAIKAGNAAVRIVYAKAKDAGELGTFADGQMHLQVDASEEVFACLLCGGSENEQNVYLIESKEAIPAAFLQEQLERLLLAEQMIVSVFDVKNDYKKMVSAKSDRTRSAYALTKNVFDCKIAAYLVNPLKSDYAVTDIAEEYLHIPLEKWSEVFGKSDLASAYRGRRKECLVYLAKEVYCLYKARPLLESALKQSHMEKLFRELEMPLTYVLFDMEREGILVKPEELKAYGEALSGRIDELEQAVHTAAGEKFNINSPKQLGEILFEQMKLPGGKKTKTGYSTAAEVLEKLAADYPIVKDILEYRGLTKLKSTYAEGLAAFIGADNKIHTNFNQTITATGRLSSTEPNLQNIPMRMELGRRIRKVFIPQEGCIFMDADYSQIELRVLAHMSDDEQLIEAYRMDEDIHRITASKVFHTPFEEVTDLQRRNAKAVNFGIVYGISSFGLSQDLSITPKEAKEYIDAYFETYPGIKKFLDQMVEDAKEKGYCETMFGRRRPVPELKSANFNQRSFGERVAMNSPIQGTAADIIKYAMIHVYDALKEKGLKSKLILQIHDELLIETRTDEIEEVRSVLTQEMQNACKLAVNLEIDLHTGSDWYEAK